VSLISLSVVRPAETGNLRITVPEQELVPQDAQLTFSMRAGGSLRFAGDEAVEIGTTDGLASTTLKSGAGLTLQDSEVAVATLEPAQALGPSARGPLRFRVVKNGTTGAWATLGTLVRLPKLTGLNCASGSRGCTLSAVGADARFKAKVDVPSGYTERSLTLPFHASALHLQLRDGGTAVARR
jgi:hypothetical protein